ncbi:FAD-dependent oxidoreductase [Colwellia sp. E2M01]|uniref:FAD-dependent oxidoreductase n=1 Tax=Colwellia sp. E2M01 TaxID=2841561 RepID=UPI001C092BBC|nr:FAD-dependent oxidoreductase [Colwellia sp. E2M01]MBU2869967.1 FAD-dependent oxidoreductase [Colwellia sp. E2M01]
MSKRVLVVGGGVVGITAAYFKALQGFNVTLLEASNEIGGLLKSSKSAFGYFDYGVHIASRTGQTELDNFLFGSNNEHLHSFNTQQAGSFFNQELTEFSPFLNFNSLNEQDKINASYELITAQQLTDFDDLESALRVRYGETVYQKAFLPFIHQTFGVSPADLPAYYIHFFDMYRVVAFDEATSCALKNVDYINDKIGFHKATAGVEKYYPKKGGIANWTQDLYQQVLSLGVKVLVNTTVTSIDYNNEEITVTYDDNEHSFDEIVWTISSAILPRFIPLKSQTKKPTFRKTVLLDFVYEFPVLSDCKYINNYSSTQVSTRLTCYQNLLPNNKFYAVTVEVLVDESKDNNELVAQVSEELNEMGLIAPTNTCIFRQYRLISEGFPIITKENDKLLKLLNGEIETRYPKIKLLGRSSSKGFFMSELLIDAYNSCKQT